MNKDQEKQLQELLFESRTSGKEMPGMLAGDDKMYRLIFDALEETPEFNIPDDFAEKTVRKAIRRKRALDLGRLLALHLGVTAILLACSATFLFFFGDGILKNIQGIVVQYKWPLIFCAGIFLVIELADDLLLKRKMRRI